MLPQWRLRPARALGRGLQRHARDPASHDNRRSGGERAAARGRQVRDLMTTVSGSTDGHAPASLPVERPLIANSVLELVGNTPLVRLNRLPGSRAASVLAKLES